MTPQGKYTILRKIADGGMAEIYLAQLHGPQGFQKRVVLKRIRPAIYADPQFRNMLIDEAHVAMTLNHSNIVQVLDLGQSAGRYFLALELVDGWSLDQLLKRAGAASHPLPRELALYIVVQVCRALAYAHSMTRDGEPLGIVHRDVSPQNILISEHGEVKLTDFGIAKVRTRDEKTAAGVVKGKIAFMSPEQAQAAPMDLRSDLFSLGTVLYFMVTDKLPFQAPTALETMVRIQAAEFRSPAKVKPKIQPDLTKIILRAMKGKPEDRYQTADEMLLEVEKVMRTVFHPAGQTELKKWLTELYQLDRVPPIGQAPSVDKTEEAEPDEQWLEIGASAIIPPTLPPQKVQPPQTSTEAEAHPDVPQPRAPKKKRRRRWPMWTAAALMLVLPWVLWGRWQRVTTPVESDSDVAPRAMPVQDAGAPKFAEPDVPDASTEILASVEPPTPPSEDEETPEEGEEERLLEQAIPDPAKTVIGDEDEPKPEEPKAEEPKPEPVPKAKPPAPKPPEPKPVIKTPAVSDTVSVLVMSQPVGSIVKMKTRVFGRTPINLRFKTGILFELTFVKSGYVTTSKRFFVTNRKDQKVTAYLKKAPAPKKRR